jgi:hypothetical protein
LRGETFICCTVVRIEKACDDGIEGTYERALVFLLLRLRRRTRFFLHLALILSADCGVRSAAAIARCGINRRGKELSKHTIVLNYMSRA